MKKFTAPEMVELKIAETANGILDVDWEGPFNIVFGDGKEQNQNQNQNKDDKTPAES